MNTHTAISNRRTISQRNDLIQSVHVNDINPDTREIFLHSDVSNSDDGIDYKCASRFIKNLAILNSMNHKPIIIHQCTCGGDWNYGIAIYDAIAFSDSYTVLLAHAHARSMSSIIPQAANRRIIMPNADFMIHFGTNSFDGDGRSFEAEGKWSEFLNTRMIDIYSQKCSRGPLFRRRKYSREKVRQYLREQMNSRREWYMTSEESVDMGFMDGVFGHPGFTTLTQRK